MPQLAATGTIPSPLQNPQTWDQVIVAGQISPGLVDIDGFKRESGWDEKTGKGTTGATLTYTSQPVAKGTLTFRLCINSLRDDVAAWYVFQPLFQYAPGVKTPQAIGVYHPALAALGETQFVTKDISPVKHKGKGLYEVQVTLWEYNPPPATNVTATPSQVDTGGDALYQKPATDADSAQISSLLMQAAAP